MRPTDENQQSTRPNLMSSGRRGGNEESILAMLDRDARGGGWPASRLALCGAGGILVVGLIGALVWLARDQGAADVIVAQTPVAVAAAPAAPAAGTAAAQAPLVAQTGGQPPTTQGATIVDEAQPPAGAPQQQDVPPLVLLAPPGQAVAAGEPAPSNAKPQAAAQASAVPPEKPSAVADAQRQDKATATAQAEPKHAPNAPAARQDRPRAHTAVKAAPTHLASHRAAARRSARQPPPKRPPAARAQPAETVDSDVALISAVIQHASNRASTPEADCGPDASCAAKATPQQ